MPTWPLQGATQSSRSTSSRPAKPRISKSRISLASSHLSIWLARKGALLRRIEGFAWWKERRLIDPFLLWRTASMLSEIRTRKGFLFPTEYLLTYLGFKAYEIAKRFFGWKLQNSYDCKCKSFKQSIRVNYKHPKIRQPSKEHQNKSNNKQKTRCASHKLIQEHH